MSYDGEMIAYTVKGTDPKLLIHCGTHGDEFGVIESVKKAVKKYYDRLPDFVFVPEVSPSAVAKRTRNNADGVDMNRSFFDGCKVEEVRDNMEIMKGKHFTMMVSFHEDPEAGSKFYLYDIRGEKIENSVGWKKVKNEVLALGVDLLTGLDDPNDPELGYEFVEGYRYFERGDTEEAISYWAADKGIIKKSLEFEIPSHLPPAVKDQIVDAIFRHLLVI